jgi:hypothetical protein
LSTTLVRFDKNCGGEGKNPMSSTTLGQFALGIFFNYFFEQKKTTTMGWKNILPSQVPIMGFRFRL